MFFNYYLSFLGINKIIKVFEPLNEIFIELVGTNKFLTIISKITLKPIKIRKFICHMISNFFNFIFILFILCNRKLNFLIGRV